MDFSMKRNYGIIAQFKGTVILINVQRNTFNKQRIIVQRNNIFAVYCSVCYNIYSPRGLDFGFW